jgi:proline iminopeptidase
MLTVPGAQLHVVEVGEGPVRVILHGGPGASHDYLRPQMDQVGGRCVYYDQRGGGKSPLDPGTPYGTVRDHVDDLERVRLHLGEPALALVGYSFGGLLAMAYALEHPDRVARLALVSPAPAAFRERDAMRQRLQAAGKRPEVEALRATLDAGDRRARFALAIAGYFVDPKRALELTPFVVKASAEEAAWKSLGEYDLRPRLETLRIPALVAHGVEDPIPIETARETARALSAELVELPACGHVPYIEAAPQLFAALHRFLGD